MENVLKRLLFSVLAAGLCSTAAWAQMDDTNEYDGRWTVLVQGDPVGERAARISLGEFAGTWVEIGSKKQRMNPCLSKKPFPITVQQSKPTVLEFRVWAASVVPGCADFSVTAKPLDPKTVEGSTEQGYVIRLARSK